MKAALEDNVIFSRPGEDIRLAEKDIQQRTEQAQIGTSVALSFC